MFARRGHALAAVLACACGETRGVILGEAPGDEAGVDVAVVDADRDAGDAGGVGSATVVIGGQSTTGQYGGPTGTASEDVCPGNQAVIGYQGFTTGPEVGAVLVGAIQTVCGQLTLGAAPSGPITTVAGATLPMRGATQDSPWTQMCPADQVVVGFSGRSGAALDQIAFACAPWTATSGVLSAGAEVTLTAAGGDGGSPYQDGCPSGQLARGSNLRSGAWIDAFGLVCGTPSLSADGGP